MERIERRIFTDILSTLVFWYMFTSTWEQNTHPGLYLEILKADYLTLHDHQRKEIYLHRDIIISKNYEFPSMVNTYSITTLDFLN